MDIPTRVLTLFPRQSPSSDSKDELLNLIANPFNTQLQSNAVISSLATSLGLTFFIALVFCALRPYNTIVYAPRARHADQKHAPPPLTKGIFAWVKPVIQTKEDMLVDKVGLDAAIFIRFTKMMRNIFLTLTLIICGILVPIYLVSGSAFAKGSGFSGITAFMRMTPQYMWGSKFWGLVACAWFIDIVICFFLWTNYRAVTRLRRNYFESTEYQASLHARTLMVTDIPKPLRSDEGLTKVVDDLGGTANIPRGAIARNVKDLPDLIEEHEEHVRELEGHLAKYLRNPDSLPARRPTCSISKNDPSYTKGQKADAIDYLTRRIQELETQIQEVRRSVDKRNPMPYGFASYEHIEEAHRIASKARGKHPEGTTVRLAPRPHDLIWKNLPLSSQQRRWKRITNQFWVAVLTLLWVAPNALIAIFLSNLANLGKVWKPFQTELNTHPKSWAVVQGVLAPAITSLFYFFLPSVFRRLSIRAGDYSKTSRERHVLAKLFNFFLFNNLIVFSLFSAIWQYAGTIIAKETNEHKSAWDALNETNGFESIMINLCNVSTFWVAWLLQRNLGAAVDLSQVWNLAYGSFMRKFGNPTPRQLIEWSAPPPFDYASYYNYFLFYASVALCFSTLQPLVLPVTAFYFALDSYLKKYLLLYIFITKTESGGQFWRVLFNRSLVTALLCNIVIALVVKSRGDYNGDKWIMIYAMAPLPILLGLFKWYCSKTFDAQIHFYTRGDTKSQEGVVGIDRKSRQNDRVGVRFGHPALYRPLMTPMVHAKAQHRLGEIYRGRLGNDDAQTIGGYSDTYSLHDMSRSGKLKEKSPFEFVSEGQMDFENFKDRDDFRSEFGGDGSVYGRAEDLSRPGTPGTFVEGHERSGSRSADSERTYGGEAEPGVTYPAGYHHTPSALREISPAPSDRRPLVSGAAPMAAGAVPTGASTSGFGYTPGSEAEDTSYDYFRRGRN